MSAAERTYAPNPTAYDWAPPEPWRCPRCLFEILTTAAGPAVSQAAGSTRAPSDSMTPRRARQLLEAALDECGWRWCRRMSLLLDELLLREERAT